MRRASLPTGRKPAARKARSDAALPGVTCAQTEVPGGINERLAAMLDEAGAFDLVERSLQAISDG